MAIYGLNAVLVSRKNKVVFDSEFVQLMLSNTVQGIVDSYQGSI